MGTKTVCSNKTNPKEIVQEIKQAFTGIDPKLIIYFVSSNINQEEFANELHNEYKGINIVGASSHAEISTGKITYDSVVAMALDEEVVEDVCVVTIDDVNNFDEIPRALKVFEKHYNATIESLELDKYVGLIYIDQLAKSEDKFMDKLGNYTDLLFVGGSAGDDLKFTKTYVHANGRAFNGGCVLTLLKPAKEFRVLKTQSFRPSDKVLTVDETDETGRVVYRFNGKPAIEAYAELMNVPVDKAGDEFFMHPVGLVALDDIYVKSPNVIDPEGAPKGSIYFAGALIEGLDYNILECTDIINDTIDAVQEKVEELDGPSAIIQANCAFRTVELQMKKLEKEYGNIFSNIETIGFSSYGEQYIGHVNQTGVMLLLK